MQRRTSQKECPLVLLLTHLAQLLQIPHLPNRRAPLHKQPLVQTPALVDGRGPSFEGNSIASHGREVVVVEPAYGFLCPGEADGDAVFLRAGFAGGFGRIAVDVDQYAGRRRRRWKRGEGRGRRAYLCHRT